MGRVTGKVAVVSGAARGQGRSHARMLAAEGADIIAIDLCEDIETNEYPLARPEDLDETARLVEKEGQRVVTEIADVRDRAALSAAIDRGVAELGHLDVVVANAGICPLTAGLPPSARQKDTRLSRDEDGARRTEIRRAGRPRGCAITQRLVAPQRCRHRARRDSRPR